MRCFQLIIKKRKENKSFNFQEGLHIHDINALINYFNMNFSRMPMFAWRGRHLLKSTQGRQNQVGPPGVWNPGYTHVMFTTMVLLFCFLVYIILIFITHTWFMFTEMVKSFLFFFHIPFFFNYLHTIFLFSLSHTWFMFTKMVQFSFFLFAYSFFF